MMLTRQPERYLLSNLVTLTNTKLLTEQEVIPRGAEASLAAAKFE